MVKNISIAVLDNDAIRAEAIRETLADEDYNVKIYTSEVPALKGLIEEKHNVVFLSTEFSDDMKEIVFKIRNYDPKANIICLMSGPNVDAQVTISELNIKHYIETPVVSTKYIIDKVETIASEIMDDEQKQSFFVSMFEQLKKISIGDKKLKRKINIAADIFSSSEEEPGKIKGSLKDVPYFEAVRLVCSVHKEGVLEIVNDEERALLVIRNKAVMSAFVTPGVRGLKAFLRVAGWEKGNFTFRNKINVSYSIEHDIAYIDIPTLCSLAKRAFEWSIRMRNNIPPKSLGIKVDINAIVEKKVDLAVVEFDVLTTVVEKNSVNDVLNYNGNSDVEVYEALIGLRRKGLIEVQSQ